jgi:hypothetical protein
MMKPRRASLCGLLSAIGLSLLASQAQAQISPWQLLANSAPNGAFVDNPLLLTDGTVLVHDYYNSNWYRLTPDVMGSYVNGTWSTVAAMASNYTPLWFASQVLPDGRVIVNGGEFNPPTQPAVYTNLGAIYDPLANTWTAVPAPQGWSHIGDAASVVLPSGLYMLANCCAINYHDSTMPLAALLDPSTMTWTPTGSGKYDEYREEGWTLLPNGKVLTVDTYVSQIMSCGKGTEIYDPSTGAWTSAGNMPSQLADCGPNFTNYTFQMGPQPLRPDGTVVAFGAISTGAVVPTAIYDSNHGTWSAGPNLPTICGTNGGTACSLTDAPAAVLPNGNILFAASAGSKLSDPVLYFELSATDNSITRVPSRNETSDSAFAVNFLVLPTGQILSTDDSPNVEIYTPSSGTYQSAWQPVIGTAPASPAAGHTYSLTGNQLGGLTQGAYYGDDVQAATNYPLVRIVNRRSGHVFYARTFNFTVSVAPMAPGSTRFSLPANIEKGPSALYVVANGIPSVGQAVTIESSATNTHDFNADGMSDIAWRDNGGNTAVWLMKGATVMSSGGFGAVPTSWSIVGQRDFDGDGSTDLLWRDSSGNTAIWFMNGAQIKSTAGVGNIPTTWSVVATGDFNGDGKGDILWQDSSGNLAVWLMNGATVVSSAGLGNVPLSFTLAGTGDFNGDGMSDLLWRDNAGNTSIWFMNGTAVTATAGVGNISTVWSVAGIGDFDADGKSDIVWRDNTGDTTVWLMNGATVSSTGGLGNVPPAWSIAQTGDYNGDGKSDLLWRDNLGNTSMWFMNGVAVASTAGVGNIPTTWTVQSMNAD